MADGIAIALFEIEHLDNPYFGTDYSQGDGDWIATGVNGEHWPITDDIFKKTYAELPVVTKYVAEYINMLKNSTDVVTASIGAIENGWGGIKLSNWIDENGNMFARAWLDGYQLEETND